MLKRAYLRWTMIEKRESARDVIMHRLTLTIALDVATDMSYKVDLCV
jgi:hypothetical protein